MSERSLFGTSGIRGPADTLFTSQFCFNIGKTFIEFLKRHNYLGPIAVGMDPRDSSPRIRNELLKGLSLGQVELFDEGVTPIPSMNWLILNTPVVAGVMITGSHIAPELNGMKFYAHDEEVSPEDQTEIEAIYNSLKNTPLDNQVSVNVIIESRAQELYSEMLFNLVQNDLPRWKVALDCANGAQSVVMPALLRRLGLNIVEVNCDPQKPFIARDTDTDDKAEIELLKETVKNNSCDFGIAFDGDGDRVVFIDENGNFVQGEYTCSLIAKETDGENVVTTISSSQVVEKIGKNIVRTRVGSPYVIKKMKEVGASFGFEQNGGGISQEIMMTRDGGSLTMKILNLLFNFGGKFSKLIETLPKFYMKRSKIDYKWNLKDLILSEAKLKFKGINLDETDGLKIWIDDSTWMLFRSSANAPEFRVFAESTDEKKAEKLLSDGLAFVQEIVTKNE